MANVVIAMYRLRPIQLFPVSTKLGDPYKMAPVSFVGLPGFISIFGSAHVSEIGMGAQRLTELPPPISVTLTSPNIL